MKNSNPADAGWTDDAGSAVDSQRFSCEEAAEILRKKSRYRELILSGRLLLPHASAAQLLGPDCLYHLYSVNQKGSFKRRKRRH